MTIYGILFIISILLLVIQLQFEFKIDQNIQTKDWLLWYTWRNRRDCTIIFPHQEKLW
jgi:hypothetical protein